MNHPCFYRISVKGIVIDKEGRVLLAREGNDTWELLGGGLDHSEDPMACLKREILEETGLVVTNIIEDPKYFLTAPSLSGNFYTANVIYQIELESLDFTPSDECQELRFFSPEEMSRIKLFPNVEQLQKLLLRA